MPLYSFKGHYPVEQIDNNKGWYEVPDKPVAPEGKEVAWVNAEWVVRDPKPEDRAGYQWNWSHNEMAWVECEYSATAIEIEFPDISLTISGSDSISLATSEPISLAASGTIDFPFSLSIDDFGSETISFSNSFSITDFGSETI